MLKLNFKGLDIYVDNNIYYVDWSKNGNLGEAFNLSQLNSLLLSIRYTDPFEYESGEFEKFLIKNVRKRKIEKLNERSNNNK